MTTSSRRRCRLRTGMISAATTVIAIAGAGPTTVIAVTVITRTITGSTVTRVRLLLRRRYDIARIAGTIVVIVATAAVVIATVIAAAVDRSRRRVHIRLVVIRTSIATRKR
jgi:hypothetical protein